MPGIIEIDFAISIPLYNYEIKILVMTALNVGDLTFMRFKQSKNKIGKVSYLGVSLI